MWIAYANGQSRHHNFASFTRPNSSHFAGVLLNQRAGIDMVHVPHNGTPRRVQNLVGGQVQTAFVPYLAVRPHVASGRVKVLAVTGAERMPALPEVRTFREDGFPDLEISHMVGAGRARRHAGRHHRPGSMPRWWPRAFAGAGAAVGRRRLRRDAGDARRGERLVAAESKRWAGGGADLGASRPPSSAARRAAAAPHARRGRCARRRAVLDSAR